MRELGAVPHSCVSETDFKKVLSFFRKVTVFQPWFMDRDIPMPKEWPDLVRVENPPGEFMPGENFRALLDE
jgi:hypothetical protein